MCVAAAHIIEYLQTVPHCRLVYSYFASSPTTSILQLLQISEHTSTPRGLEFEGVYFECCFIWHSEGRKLQTTEKKFSNWCHDAIKGSCLVVQCNSAAFRARRGHFLFFYMKGEPSCHLRRKDQWSRLRSHFLLNATAMTAVHAGYDYTRAHRREASLSFY